MYIVTGLERDHAELAQNGFHLPVYRTGGEQAAQHRMSTRLTAGSWLGPGTDGFVDIGAPVSEKRGRHPVQTTIVLSIEIARVQRTVPCPHVESRHHGQPFAMAGRATTPVLRSTDVAKFYGLPRY